jgi:hypothetical protein
MSYLDVPRLHFAGGLRADPSTVNNFATSYDPGATLQPLWNPDGTHRFLLRECTVRSTVDASGVLRRAAADDTLVGGSVVATQAAKLVDLDPAFQLGSQIWGLELRVSAASGGGRVHGRMATATMRDVWFARGPEGFAKGIGAAYQSVLTDLSWEPGSGSPVLEELRRASPERLSVKFVAYAYTAEPDSGQFRLGRVVGTIGPVRPGEPDHFLAARRASATPGAALGSRRAREAPFGAVPFQLDPTRSVVVLDLGNAVPEQSGGGEPTPLGTMQAVLLEPPPEALGSIDYSKAHYEMTAGVNELAISPEQAQRLAGGQLGITVSTVGGGSRLIMAERPAGLYVDATDIVWRMDPGTPKSVDLIATKFGAPATRRSLGLAILSGTPVSALTIPSSSIETDATGRATVSFTAGDPRHPREELLDGQYYIVGFFDGDVSPSKQLGHLHIRVFDRHPEVADPTWTDVRSILAPYARLYPSMQAVFDLGDEKVVREHLEQIGQRLNLSQDDPLYMPVTRDLSRDKRELLLRWLDRGAP